MSRPRTIRQPRSKGCRECVARHLKCDLALPACGRCQKAKRQCPGYPLRLLPGLPGAAAKKPAPGHGSVAAQQPSDPAEDRSVGSDGATVIQNGNVFHPNPPRGAHVLTQPRPDNNHWAVDIGICSPLIQQRQLFELFASSLVPTSQQNPTFFRNYGDWLRQLAQLQGTNSLLDTTFRAVSLAHLSLLHHNPKLMNESRALYVNSLTMLNKTLLESKKGRSSETLSATIMLSFYEMFASHHATSTGYDTWVKHAGGAGMLMQMRGPRAHRHGMDRSMFLAYRNTLVIEAFDALQPCFLDKQPWRKLAEEIHEEIRSAMPPEKGREILDLSEAIYMELIKFPAVLRDAYYVVELTRASGAGRHKVRDDIVNRTRERKQQLKTKYFQLDRALQTHGQTVSLQPSHPPDPVFPNRYIWPNVFTASHYNGSWNVLMIMNMILIVFDRDEARRQSYVEDNIEFARRVCRGADYMAKSSFLGPFYLTFGLRISLLCLQAPEELQWAGMKLMEIGRKLGMAKSLGPVEGSVPSRLQKEVEKLEQLDDLDDKPNGVATKVNLGTTTPVAATSPQIAIFRQIRTTPEQS